MTEIRARLAKGRAVDVDDFADLTTVPVEAVEWAEDGSLAVRFAAEVPASVAEAVERRIVSRDATEETLRAEAAAYLLIASPTEAERNAQMDRLTRITLAGPVE